jgi:hypothetical protein
MKTDAGIKKLTIDRIIRRALFFIFYFSDRLSLQKTFNEFEIKNSKGIAHYYDGIGFAQ